MTRIVCISDTHGQHEKIKVPYGDILVFAGDLTGMRGVDEPGQLRDFNKWYASLPHTHKVLIAGNHDFELEKALTYDLKHMYGSMGVHYLCDSGVTIDGLKFWGAPWQPEFHGWAFNLERGHQLRNKWSLIPDDTNVLVTHGPPFSILDQTRRFDLAGCKDLLRRVTELDRLKLHVFGHIHESYGRVDSNGGKVFINCSVLDHIGKKLNNPIEVDISLDDR